MATSENETRPLQVDSLQFTVLVDNSIEWMTPLPPGFLNEARLQLQNGLPCDHGMTGAPIVDLPNFCCGAHGLSVLITTEQGGQRRTMLFDTGPDGRALERNLDALKLSTKQIETVVLSHWHADHTGGLLTLLKRDQANLQDPSPGRSGPLTVDTHTDRPTARGIWPPGAPQVMARLPADPSFDEIEQLGATVKSYKGLKGHSVLGGTVWVSGEIPRQFEWETGLIGSVKWVGEEGSSQWAPDEPIHDERYIAIDVRDKGLVIFSACSHTGICNVVADARKTFKDRPVHMVIGGLHLAGPELLNRIAPTVKYLSDDAQPEFVVPLHCTGLRAKVALANAFGDRCVAGGVGIQVSIPAPQPPV